MKYQVGFSMVVEGEMSIEADNPEEAKEIVRDELMSLYIADACFDVTQLITDEPYEWDDAAQERNMKQNQELFAKYPISKQVKTD